MKLFVCSTYYHVLISCLKAIDNEDNNIMITDYIPNGIAIFQKLKKSNLFRNVFYIESVYYRAKTKIEKVFITRKRWIKETNKKFLFDFSLYSDIYLFMDDIWIAKYLKFNKIYYNICEDGLDVFKNIMNSPFAYMIKLPFKRKLKKILFPWSCFNVSYYLKSRYIKTIEVNDKSGIVFKDDSRIIELNKEQSLFSKLQNEINLRKILDIFLDNSNILSENNICLVFTYPFFVDGIINNQEEQINIYKKIAEKYNNYNVFIKPHPRDNTDYSSIKDTIILSRYFPSELLKYIDLVKIEKIVSIFSSSVLIYPKEKVVFFKNLDDFYKKFDKYIYDIDE